MSARVQEILIELFRESPTISIDFLKRILPVEIPAYDKAEFRQEALDSFSPKNTRPASAVVFSKEGVTRLAIALELQFDDTSPYRWPHHVSAWRAKLRAPVFLLVLTLDQLLTDILATPISLGHPGYVFKALVAGPKQIPRITNVEEGRRNPQLALISAFAHADSPGGLAVLLAACAGLLTLDDARARFYHDFVLTSLGEATLRELDAMTAEGRYDYQSDFAKKYFTEGREKGRIEGQMFATRRLMLRMLSQRRWAPNPEQMDKIEAASLAQLERWFDHAPMASNLAELLAL